MKLKSTIVMILIVVLFFGGIFFTQAMGWWSVAGGGGGTGNGTGNGNSSTPNRLNLEQTDGNYDPADIRGSFTYDDVSNLFNIPLEDLIDAFQLPDGANAGVYRVNSLEDIFENTDYEMGTSSIKLFVAYYTGLPYERTEESYLLESAVDVLKAQGNLTGEQEEYLAAHTISMEEFELLKP